jgi:hypothetical protein
MRAVFLILCSSLALRAAAVFTTMGISPVEYDFSQAAVKIVGELNAVSTVGTTYLVWCTSPTCDTSGANTTQRGVSLPGNVTVTERSAYAIGYPANGQRLYIRLHASDSAGVENTAASWECTATGTSGVPGITLTNGVTCNGIGEYPSFVTPVYNPDLAKPRLPIEYREAPPTGIPPANVRTITNASNWDTVLAEGVNATCGGVNADPWEIKLALGVEFPANRATPKKQGTCLPRIYVHADESEYRMPPLGVQRPSWWYAIAGKQAPRFTGQLLPHRNADIDYGLKLFSTCEGITCVDTTVRAACGGTLYCSYGWYFRGLDFVEPDGKQTTPYPHATITAINAADGVGNPVTSGGTRLYVTLGTAGYHGGQRSVIYLDTRGMGITPELVGWHHLDAQGTITSTRFWVAVGPDGTYGGTQTPGSTGKAWAAVTQNVASISAQPDQDIIVTAAEGFLMPFATGDLVKFGDLQGVSGLVGPTNTDACTFATSNGRCTDWYKATKIDDRTISLDYSKNQLVGTHVPNTGWIAAPTYIHFKMLSQAQDSSNVVWDQIRADGRGFPTRTNGMSFMGAKSALINSQIVNIQAGLPLDETGNWTSNFWANFGSPQRRNDFLAFTPNAISFQAGDQKLIENNYVLAHGQSAYAADSTCCDPETNSLQYARNITMRRNVFDTPASWIANRYTAYGLDLITYNLQHARQTVECKQCWPFLFEGNTIIGTFSGESSTVYAMSLTPAWNTASTATNARTWANATFDATIRNNIFSRTPGFANFYGVSNFGTGMRPVFTQRVSATGNLFIHNDANGQRSAPSGQGATFAGYQTGSGMNGAMISAGGGSPLGSFTFRHNTYVDNHGAGYTGVRLQAQPGGGWDFSDNIVEFHHTGSYVWLSNEGATGASPWSGSGTLTRSTANGASNMWNAHLRNHSRWTNNALIRGAITSTENPDETGMSAANCTAFQASAGSYQQGGCYDDQSVNTGATVNERRAQVGFVGYSATAKAFTRDDYSLKYSSKLNSGGGSDPTSKARPSSDGLQVGADQDMVDAATGRIKHAFFINGSSTKVLQLLGPDRGTACYAIAATLPGDPAVTPITDTTQDRYRRITIPSMGSSDYVWGMCERSPDIVRCSASGGPCTVMPH